LLYSSFHPTIQINSWALFHCVYDTLALARSLKNAWESRHTKSAEMVTSVYPFPETDSRKSLDQPIVSRRMSNYSANKLLTYCVLGEFYCERERSLELARMKNHTIDTTGVGSAEVL